MGEKKSNAGWRCGKNLVKDKEKKRTQRVVEDWEESVRDSGKSCAYGVPAMQGSCCS